MNEQTVVSDSRRETAEVIVKCLAQYFSHYDFKMAYPVGAHHPDIVVISEEKLSPKTLKEMTYFAIGCSWGIVEIRQY